ncbi:MAG: hypothetical protein ACTHLB_07100 [Parafilimonas sp.]
MYKKISCLSFLYKGVYLTLFSLLFFIQLQPKFIEASNDFISIKPSSVQKTSCDNRTEAQTTSKETFIKVSKRFDVSSQFILSPAFLVSKTIYESSYVWVLYKEVFVKNNNCLQRLLRGPPSFF